MVNGQLAVAWQEEGSIGGVSLYVKKYIKNGFKPFGAALDTHALNNATEPSITMDNRPRPVVAWTETVDNFGSTDILVKRWLGTAWSASLPVPDSVASNNTYEPSIKVEKSSVLGAFRPVVAFSEELVPGVRNIMVRRWNGTSWTDYGAGNLNNNPANNAVQPSLALNSSNRPIVAWIENFDVIVKAWTGSTWQQLGSALDKKLENNASNPSIAIDSLGRVLVAWEEYDFPNTTNIHLKRWDGTSWTFLGDILDRNPGNNSFSPSLVIDSTNQPVVAWHESVSGSYNVYAKRWNGNSWLNLGGFIDRTSTSVATYPALAMGTDNNPVISWDDGGSIYVKRWNPATLKWVLVSTQAVDGTLSQIATFPSITLDASNKPIVAYQKAITASNNDVLVRGF